MKRWLKYRLTTEIYTIAIHLLNYLLVIWFWIDIHDWRYRVVIAIMFSINFLMPRYVCMLDTVTVNASGVTMRRYLGKKIVLQWSEIATIGFAAGRGQGCRTNKLSYIYFSSEKVEQDYIVFSERLIKHVHITVQFRASIIREIEKYWGRRIKGIANLVEDGELEEKYRYLEYAND